MGLASLYVLLILVLIYAINGSKSLDPYEILGAHKKATLKDIQKLYRQKALKYHPDKNKDNDASKHMEELNEAYAILRDEERRRIYDEYGPNGIPLHKTIDPSQHFSTFYPHFTFDFDWSTGFYRDNVINLKKYEIEILPASHLYPFLIVIYAESCVLCYKFEPMMQNLAKDLEVNGIKVYAVNSRTQPALVKKLNAPAAHESNSFFSFSSDYENDKRKPTIIGLIDGKVIPYQSPTLIPTTTGLITFVRDTLIGPRVTPISLLENPDSFEKSILTSSQRLLDNRVRLLIITPSTPTSAALKPKLRHLVLAYRLRANAIFGWLSLNISPSTLKLLANKARPAERITRDVVRGLGLDPNPTSGSGDIIALLRDFEGFTGSSTEPAYFTVKNPYKSTYFKEVLAGINAFDTSTPALYLPLVPRISSQDVFEALCPPVPELQQRHSAQTLKRWRACTLLLVRDSDFNALTAASADANTTQNLLTALRLVRSCRSVTSSLRLGYILTKRQSKFLDSLTSQGDQLHSGGTSSFEKEILGPTIRLAQLETRSTTTLLLPLLTLMRLPYQEIRFRLDVVPYHQATSERGIHPKESLLHAIAFQDSRAYTYVSDALHWRSAHERTAGDPEPWCHNVVAPLDVILNPENFEVRQTPLRKNAETLGLHHYELRTRLEENRETIKINLDSVLPKVAIAYRGIVDEFGLGLLKRTLNRLGTYKEYVTQRVGTGGLDRNDAFTVLSVLFSFLFILGGGYFMAYLVRLEEEKIAQENRDYPTKLPNRIVNQDMIFHELKPGTYNALIRLLKPGCRTILILLNEETKDKLLNKFSRIVHPYRKNVSLMFGFVMIDKYITWYRRLLLQVIGNGRRLVINPKNCVGTVLAVNGYRKYYCIYHARHSSQPGPDPSHSGSEDGEDQGRTSTPPPPSYSSLLLSGSGLMPKRGEDRDSGISLGGAAREPLLDGSSNGSEGSVRLRRSQKDCNPDDSTTDIADGCPFDNTSTPRNLVNPLFVEDLLNAFPDWLDRLFEGTVQRYYIDYWPPMKL